MQIRVRRPKASNTASTVSSKQNKQSKFPPHPFITACGMLYDVPKPAYRSKEYAAAKGCRKPIGGAKTGAVTESLGVCMVSSAAGLSLIVPATS
jgi:hypothetical protein